MSKLIVEMVMPKACRWYEDGTKKRCPIAEWGGARIASIGKKNRHFA